MITTSAAELVGNWSWTVWLLIPLALALAPAHRARPRPARRAHRGGAPRGRRHAVPRPPRHDHGIDQGGLVTPPFPFFRSSLVILMLLVAAACGQKSGVGPAVLGRRRAARRATAPPDDHGAPRPGPTSRAERQGRRHRQRDRHRHPRAGHRRVADPADQLRHRQGHLLEVPRRERPRGARSVARCGSCSATTSSTRTEAVQVCREMVEKEKAVPARGRRRRRPDHRLRQVRRRAPACPTSRPA